MKLTLALCLTVLALLVAKRPTITTVSDHCEPVSCPVERCTSEEVRAIEQAECEWAKGSGATALVWCEVKR